VGNLTAPPEELLERFADAIGDGGSLPETAAAMAREYGATLESRTLEPKLNACGNSFLWRIHVDPRKAKGRGFYATSHEIAHFILAQWMPENHDERVVHRGTRALMMPRGPFYEAIDRVGLDLLALIRLYPRPPPEVVALRLADLVRSVVVTTWEGVRLTERVVANDLLLEEAESAARWAEEAVGGLGLRGMSPRSARSDLGRATSWRLTDGDSGVGAIVCQILRDPILVACERGELVYDEGYQPLGAGCRLLP
jgi:hypothetical protein